MSWLSRLFRRSDDVDGLAEELQEHIEEKTEQLMRLENLSREQARAAALRAFGNRTLIETRSREVWQWPALESVLADTRLALRRLRKSPGFAITVLLTLAIGIGANTAVFTVVNRILLRPLPYPDSNRFVSLWLDAPGAGGLANFSSGLQLSTSMSITFADHNHTLQSMGIWSPGTANVTGIATPELVQVVGISDGVLETLGIPASVGRWFSADDQQPRGAKSVMLSYGYWQRRFGSDPNIIGRSIQVDSENRTVVGIMPRGFRLVDHDFDLLIPLALDRHHQILAGFGYNGIARLKAGVSIPQADADIARLVPVWMDSWSNGPGTNQHYYDIWHITPKLRPLKQQVVGNIGNVLWVVMSTVGLVMLIACTNVANLLLVRAEARASELSIRAALGATRKRIARELMTESLLLGLLGGAAAVAVAYGGLRLLTAAGPADLPRLSEVSFDGASLLFTFVLAVFSGLFFGSIPVLRYARATPSLSLSGTTRSASSDRSRRRSRDLLVVAQVAMALVLMVCASLMIRTFASLRNVDPGFADTQHVETVSITVPDLLVPGVKAVAQMQNQIRDNLAAIPGVTSASYAADVPMDGNDPNWDTIAVEFKKYDGNEGPLRMFNYVAPDYFKTMGTRIVAGRDFNWDDLQNIRPYVMVSESFARDSWGSAAAAIGKRVKKYSGSPWQQVIGVVEDVHVHGVGEKAPPLVYWPAMFYDRYGSHEEMDGLRTVTYVVHSSRTGTQSLLSEMQRAVWSVSRDLPLASVDTMQNIYSRSMARTSFTLVMLGIAASMALALGLIGIYGVISYAVAQRTREIGIRLALGAQRGSVRWMFVRSALVLTGIGVVVGLGAAAAIAQLMRTLLFGVSPVDPVSFAAVPIVLAASSSPGQFPARPARLHNQPLRSPPRRVKNGAVILRTEAVILSERGLTRRSS